MGPTTVFCLFVSPSCWSVATVFCCVLCAVCGYYEYLVPIMGFGLVYSVHKYGGCWRYYTLHMVDRYSNLVDTTLLHHDFALDI